MTHNPRPAAARARSRGALAAAGTAAALLLLAGCGTPGGGTGGGTTSGGKVALRLTWWGNPTRASATEAAIELFEAAHPDISVQLEPSAYPGYYDKLNTEITAGDAPDVFQIDTVAKYAGEGALTDLGPQSSVLNTSAIPPSYLAQGSLNGKLYEVPAGSNIFSLVYNSSLVKQAGASVPSGGMSWQQYADLAKQISAAGHGTYWGSGDDSANTQAFEIFVRQRGENLYSADGKHVGFTTKDVVDWWNYWAQMRADGSCPPATVTEPGVAGDVTKAAIVKNQVAMDVYGTSTSLPGSGWMYTAFPGEGTTPGVYLKRSVNWSVYAKSQHPKEAAELISFLVNDQSAGKALGLSRGAPANGSVLSALSSSLTGNEQQIAQYTSYAAGTGHNSTPPAPEPAAAQQVDSPKLFAQQAENVWFGKQSVQDAASRFVSQANQILAGQ